MRKVPTQVALSVGSHASTLTRLLRIVLTNGVQYGICMSNRDVAYDHGDGLINYVASNGFDPSAFSSDITYSVDNAEGYALISNDVPGVTEDMVRTGQLDNAQWVCYYVDYVKPYKASAVILDAGDVGIVKSQFGMMWIPELLSYVIRLKQNVGDVYSRTCRATFGSPASQQHGCGFDAESLWQAFTVTSVGAESDRTFDTIGLVQDLSRPFYPGRVQWLTGDNLGKSVSIEDYSEDTSADQTVSLIETMPYAIQVGDTGRLRPDCLKTEDACKAYGNFVNMKAETLIPIGDTAAISTPGAQT